MPNDGVRRGIAMATSPGFAAPGAASAAAPALHVKNGAKWSVESDGGGCEVAQFHSNGTFFASLNSDAGKWSGGATTLTIKWTSGGDKGLKFTDTYGSSTKQYSGTLRNPDGN